MRIYTQLIGGDRISGDAVVPNVNPSDTNDIIGHVAQATAALAEQAVDAAAEAFGPWSATGPQERYDVLDRAGSEVLERQAELADLLAREEGKTTQEALGEVVRSGRILKFQAGEALRSADRHLASVREGVEVTVTHEPVGVVSVITPWNFPLAIPTWKIAPALVHGNTVVFKPAGLVPASAWELVDILNRAGLPPGALNLVMGPGSTVGEVLAASPKVDAVSFTGSTEVGDQVLRSATGHRARAQLEMGGKNPLVVADDAELDLAVTVALEGAFGSTGQRCTASSRLVVMSAIYDRFVESLLSALDSWTVGDARAAGVKMGPVVSEDQLASDLDYLEIAGGEGARIVGGLRPRRESRGWYLSPAVVLDSGVDDTINRVEVFGPVASIIRVDDFDEAVRVANDTDMRLTSGIVTRSLAKAHEFQRRSRAGMVMVNAPTAGVDFHVPFGGRGASSVGPREQGVEARAFYTVSKTTYVAPGSADRDA